MPTLALPTAFKPACQWFSSAAVVLALFAGPLDTSLAQGTADPGIRYSSSEFVLPPDVDSMLSVDLNADGYPDLLAIRQESLNVYLQQANNSFDFGQPSAAIALSGAGMGWDIANVRRPGSDEEAVQLLALVDGRRILAWDFAANTVNEPEVLLDALPGFLPKGLFRLRFVRDINDDGYMDFIVPGAEQLHLYLQEPGGTFQDAITVQSNHFKQTSLNANAGLQARVGQALTIPMMELRDLNSDGLNDLISRSDERIDVFWSQSSDGAPGFPAIPTYSVDLASLQAGMENFSLDQIDFSNLTAALAMTYNVLMTDVNSDGFDDVVVREGGKISLFTSASSGIDFEQPQQVLRSSGNVMGAYVRDENDDGLPDLWLARVETISIGDVFVWLALSGTLDVEVFIYRNEGSQFARRPSRKLTLAVKYPSALSLLSTGLEFERDLRADRETVVNPMAEATLDQNSLDELVVLVNDRLDVYFDMQEHEQVQFTTPEQRREQAEQSILTFFGYRADQDSYEIDIRAIMDEIMAKAGANTDLLAGREPDLQLPLGTSTTIGDVFALDLNQDGVDDFVVFLDGDEEQISGKLLWSKTE